MHFLLNLENFKKKIRIISHQRYTSFPTRNVAKHWSLETFILHPFAHRTRYLSIMAILIKTNTLGKFARKSSH